MGVDLAGLNFVPTSKRCITLGQAESIRSRLLLTKAVGLFRDQDLELVNKITTGLKLDYIQLHGQEDADYISRCQAPVIKNMPLRDQADIDLARSYLPAVRYILFDGSEPGQGRTCNHSLLSSIDFPFLLAGGITPDNVQVAECSSKILGVDVASGVETDGVVDKRKIAHLIDRLDQR
ncbi:MAG: phosphoribosylanthranilate isomerase [Deltaproteobacteria bacterium]|nr:phosphoribosylanthranilate isomerase [Deltaproteobacteria bacterium]